MLRVQAFSGQGLSRLTACWMRLIGKLIILPSTEYFPNLLPALALIWRNTVIVEFEFNSDFL